MIENQTTCDCEHQPSCTGACETLWRVEVRGFPAETFSAPSRQAALSRALRAIREAGYRYSWREFVAVSHAEPA